MNKYLEAHITVEPRSGMTYPVFVQSMTDYQWKSSKFEHDDVDGIAGKWFISCRSPRQDLIEAKVYAMVDFLTKRGFEVLRWKIEQTLFDSKLGDQLIDLV